MTALLPSPDADYDAHLRAQEQAHWDSLDEQEDAIALPLATFLPLVTSFDDPANEPAAQRPVSEFELGGPCYLHHRWQERVESGDAYALEVAYACHQLDHNLAVIMRFDRIAAAEWKATNPYKRPVAIPGAAE